MNLADYDSRGRRNAVHFPKSVLMDGELNKGRKYIKLKGPSSDLTIGDNAIIRH